METITVTVNDEPKTVPSGATIDLLLKTLSVKPHGIAVAINSEVVPQQEWIATEISANDSVLIITATQGG